MILIKKFNKKKDNSKINSLWKGNQIWDKILMNKKEEPLILSKKLINIEKLKKVQAILNKKELEQQASNRL